MFAKATAARLIKDDMVNESCGTIYVVQGFAVLLITNWSYLLLEPVVQ